MMVVNIIIGWAALRGSMKNPAHYTHQMFVVDIVIVLTFFFMNNAILFSFGGTLSLDKVSGLQTLLNTGVQLHTVAFLAAALYALTAIFLLLCKFWNKMFYAAAGVSGMAFYEGMLWVIIVMSSVLAIVAGWQADSLCIQGALLPIWLLAWIYINGHWLTYDFFSAKPSQAVVVSPAGPPAPSSTTLTPLVPANPPASPPASPSSPMPKKPPS